VYDRMGSGEAMSDLSARSPWAPLREGFTAGMGVYASDTRIAVGSERMSDGRDMGFCSVQILSTTSPAACRTVPVADMSERPRGGTR